MLSNATVPTTRIVKRSPPASSPPRRALELALLPPGPPVLAVEGAGAPRADAERVHRVRDGARVGVAEGLHEGPEERLVRLPAGGGAGAEADDPPPDGGRGVVLDGGREAPEHRVPLEAHDPFHAGLPDE